VIRRYRRLTADMNISGTTCERRKLKRSPELTRENEDKAYAFKFPFG